MGRYYDGDISGKFWFGVQSSDDADYFGVEGTQPSYIEYYFDKDNLADVEKGVSYCREVLGDNLERLDKFFNTRQSYNDDMIKEVWLNDYKTELSDMDINVMLQWYARLDLGDKILDRLREYGECQFRAEV